MVSKARIIFAGSPDFAVAPLHALLESGHDVVAVFTQPDRPAGRGRKLAALPVKLAAQQAGIPVYQPATLRDPDIQAQLRALDADLMVVVAYGLLLPEEVLSLPRLGCINLHASLLPRWRGAAPIQMAVHAGDPETGVCIMQMDAGLDTGPVLATAKTTIGEHETAGELHDRLAPLGAQLLAAELPNILSGALDAQPQASTGVEHAPRIKKVDGLIDWQQSAVDIDRQIRAFNPWPMAYTSLAGESLRCWRAAPAAHSGGQAAPGTVVATSADGIEVQTGVGTLLLTGVQQAGRKQVAASDFARDRALPGAVLGN